MWKLEEQVLPPAVHTDESGRAASRGATPVRDELPLMRELSLLALKAPQAQRELAFSVLKGVATLNFSRIKDRLDTIPDAPTRSWTQVHDAMVTTVQSWNGEVLAHGEIEDQDPDPVGQAPR